MADPRRRAADVASTLALVFCLVGSAHGTVPHFEEVALEEGILFQHVNGVTPEKPLPTTYGSGAAFFDLEGDGDLDVYLVNGGSLRAGRGTAINGLFRNDVTTGGPRYARVAEAAGAPGVGYGMGVLAGDYDGDGDTDLYCTELGSDRLYVNDRYGVFHDATLSEGLGGSSWGTSAAYLDADLDGDLDLFVVDYVQYDPDNNPWCGRRDLGLRLYCDPLEFPATPDRLYNNRGGGAGPRFVEVGAASGITARGNGLGVVAADFDGDGDTDLYVANDMTPNLFYENDGAGVFVDRALMLGTALSADGAAQAGMGVDAADYDEDGDPDLIVTNYQLEHNALYRNEGDWWTDLSFVAGIGEHSLNHLGFGAGFFDMDNDGWLDLFVTNGHVHDNIESYDPIVTHAQRVQVMRNEAGRFDDVTDEVGLQQRFVGRGSAFGDYDADGDVDILVSSNGMSAALLRNEGGGGQSIRVKLRGPAGNLPAAGATAIVVIGTRRLTRWAKVGTGYLSTSETALHFGIGDSSVADSLIVRWPRGGESVLTRVPAGEVTVTAGQ
ncbi:MAG: CRTAC1 family protein [Gemmatimonadetes bacterium]|jgi:enediyne biosynthesis protein E4|nr:CRTAC1 family protein [Gemmatimonadota bacterium]MBT7861232.1 CRTAC1 family protein [Gemmatimonadota bacterium]